MAAPRKKFRIEETAASQRADPAPDAPAPALPASPVHAELMAELAALRALLAALAPKPADKPDPSRAAAARLKNELGLIACAIGGSDDAGDESPAQGAPLTRIAHELEEVVNSTDQATQKVLAAAEQIDQVANHLTAALRGQYELGLAHDIQDLVIRIFEACNFQDVAGQRVSKVLATLNFVAEHVTRMIEEIKAPEAMARADAEQHLHGPPLRTDSGHVTQAEIDALFAR
jgi:chemotaxis protein CheZ